MLPFKLVYNQGYYLPIGGHVFPAEKYHLIHKRLLQGGIVDPGDLLEAAPAEDRDVLLVHTSDYVYRLQNGTLSAREELQMEIPYSYELVDAFWLAAGGSILAARRALDDGVCFNVCGGFHHAFPNHGEGFCMIHDVAIAIRRVQKDRRVAKAMVVDCDVHQGNGTAYIFNSGLHGGEPLPLQYPVVSGSNGRVTMNEGASGDVFTISLHQENNYPAWKPPSSIDVNLPDGCPDDEYLEWLEKAVSRGLENFTPDLLCYVAGADPYREDQLGGLGLSIDGLKRRDEYVFRVAQAREIPVMVTFAGGYAQNLDDTVTIHCNSVLAAREVFAAHSSQQR